CSPRSTGNPWRRSRAVSPRWRRSSCITTRARTAVATVESAARPSQAAPLRALARRAFADARIRTLAFAYLFAVYAFIQPVGYRHAYPDAADRAACARSFAQSVGLRLFYGEPHRVDTVDGYTAWRVGGTLAIAAAIFGLLAAVRALRADEDAGRTELVLSGVVARRTLSTAAAG